MGRLDPGKLHVRCDGSAGEEVGAAGTRRRYTLTHSDMTGELFLTIAADYDQAQLSGWYVRLMRDEVLAEWQDDGGLPALHVYCHVSGGLVLGWTGMRDAIFRRELPLALEAICYGDRAFLETRPELMQAPITVHFEAAERRYQRVEKWGVPGDYRQS